jgi:hypothetical protein
MTPSEIPNKLPGLDKIGGGVNTKTAAYAAWNSITSLLKNLPCDQVVQVLSKSYNIPSGFSVSVGNTSRYYQVVGSGRDTYMKQITASLTGSGSYGGFSGTLKSSFNMAEDTTESYSFGTHVFEQQLYSLTLPKNLDGLLDPQFDGDLKGPMSPTEFYDKYGTHYTSSILVGAKASLSLFSQFKSQYSESTFKTDLSAAYKGIAGSFQTTGSYSYNSHESHEAYQSSTSLVLVGGDTTKTTMHDWQSTVADFPVFIDFNTQANGLLPIYQLLPEGSPRREQLKAALRDYLNPPLKVHIFCAASTLTEFPTETVRVPDGYKILSGGAKVTYGGEGELLTASYPISGNQWTAKAKDNFIPDTGILTVYAVAVYDPHDWLDVKVFSNPSPSPRQAPVSSVKVDTGYAMTGGGAQTSYTGQGSYLTGSYPVESDTWVATSKDHLQICDATITAYAIGVKWSLAAITRFPGLQAITSQYVAASSDPNRHPEFHVGAPEGTTMVGGGALVDYGRGEGNMLYASYPKDANTWRASGKSQEKVSMATLTSYAIGVKNMVTPTIP